ncbi:hypothetical protein LWI28_027474 [Acer negundo]|uniref:Small ribosomal subunit protein mS38 n=1 Tax=Acer negundo TaxID=4023 RepID=A0AAD5IY07_ACENE|nr:hypothetical protein LWI28_027474 [Acer negundo]
MASSLHKLMKKPLPIRLIFSLHTQQSPNFNLPSLFLNKGTHHIDNKPDHHYHFLDPSPLKNNNLTHFNSSFFYPSFPFGFALDPILSNESIQSELDDVGSGMVWADSVKKKRKKKMNKHKYRKLRKRISRQT